MKFAIIPLVLLIIVDLITKRKNSIINVGVITLVTMGSYCIFPAFLLESFQLNNLILWSVIVIYGGFRLLFNKFEKSEQTLDKLIYTRSYLYISILANILLIISLLILVYITVGSIFAYASSLGFGDSFIGSLLALFIHIVIILFIFIVGPIYFIVAILNIADFVSSNWSAIILLIIIAIMMVLIPISITFKACKNTCVLLNFSKAKIFLFCFLSLLPVINIILSIYLSNCLSKEIKRRNNSRY